MKSVERLQRYGRSKLGQKEILKFSKNVDHVNFERPYLENGWTDLGAVGPVVLRNTSSFDLSYKIENLNFDRAALSSG